MSELQRKMQKKLGGIPPPPPPPAPNAGLLPPKLSSSSTSKRFRRQKDYAPIHWSRYFESSEIIKVGGDSSSSSTSSAFKVYKNGSEGPLLVLLHGGGYSGLTWACFATQITKMVKCRILALDLRGHGETSTADDEDLSSETLANDVADVIQESKKNDEISAVDTVLIGHSMGGAIAVHTALGGRVDGLVGLVVIDVVEGTAMDALTSMQGFLRSRPKKFESLDYAIEWSVRSGQVRNVESARVSMPGQLKNAKTNLCATSEVKEIEEPRPHEPSKLHPSSTTSNAILEEEDQEQEESKFKAPIDDDSGYTWRIDLSKTERHWPGWFQGLSNNFLSVPASKLLLLAGVDRLDRDLTVGQMQGKFQMQILPQAGHAVHEDLPDRVAEILATFLVRNKFTEGLSEFTHTFPAC